MGNNIEGKIVVITGASSGLGAHRVAVRHARRHHVLVHRIGAGAEARKPSLEEPKDG